MNNEIIGIAKLATALNKAQSVMRGAKKDKKNPFFKSNFSDLASVFEAIKEPFADNGLCISQILDIHESGQMLLITKMMHTSGEFLDSRMLLPPLLDPQKIGSCLTYFKRYSLMAIAGLPSEDDDGNKASSKAVPAPHIINDAHVEQLEILINGHDDVRELVLKNCAGNLRTMTVDRFPGAMRWIKDMVQEKEANNV